MSHENKIDLPERIINNPNYVYGSQFKFDPVITEQLLEDLKKRKNTKKEK